MAQRIFAPNPWVTMLTQPPNFMKYPTCIFLFSFLAASLFSQTPADTLAPENEVLAKYSLICYWEKGEVLNYEIVKGKLKFKSEELVDSTASTSQMSLTVVDSSEKHYLIDVGYESGTDLSDIGVDNETASEIMKMLGGLRLQYETDEMGAFQDFKNSEQIVAGVQMMLKSMMKKKDIPAEKQKLLDNLLGVFSSESFIKEKFLQEAQLLHLFHGRMWTVDSLMKFNDELPNRFDPAKPTIANSSLHFVPDADNEGSAFLFYTMKIPEKESKEILGQTFDKLKLTDDPKFLKEFEKATITIEDSNTYYIHMSSGTVTSFYRERRIKFDEETTVQFVEINLK